MPPKFRQDIQEPHAPHKDLEGAAKSGFRPAADVDVQLPERVARLDDAVVARRRRLVVRARRLDVLRVAAVLGEDGRLHLLELRLEVFYEVPVREREVTRVFGGDGAPPKLRRG